MYSLDINFLKDRIARPAEPLQARSRSAQESQRPLYLGVAVGTFLPALVLGLWFFLSNRNAALEARQAELDSQLAALNAQLGEIETINTQISAIQTETQALATVFDQIKPWSAVLTDVRGRVPSGVQVSLIEQTEPEAPAATPPPTDPETGQPAAVAPPPPPPPSTIAITGQARSFNDVNDFLLTLQRSPFLSSEDTRLITATLIDNPINIEFAEGSQGDVEVELPQVVQYTIQSSLTDLPASELLQDLERTLAVGLAARIQALRDRGVLQP